MDNLRKVLNKTVLGKSGEECDARIASNFNSLPVYELSYPNNDIQAQHIAPYDQQMKEKLSFYFPTVLRKESLKPGQRPRSLSLQSGNPGNIDWNTKKSMNLAYAMSISLYEKDCKEPKCNVGDPIADCCAVITTRNYVIMVCADGCGWGEGACAAARIAVLSMLRVLTKNVLGDIYRTTEVFEYLCKGINAVQKDLVESDGSGLTTICASVIAPLKYHPGEGHMDDNDVTSCFNHVKRNDISDSRWVVCNVRVGDSGTYRYNSTSKQLSILSHRFRRVERDLQDAGGCLGPVVGPQPDLANLQYSVSLANSDCTILQATDGVVDNFNPYVTTQLLRAGHVECPERLLHRVYCSCADESGTCDIQEIPKHKDLRIGDVELKSHSRFCKCSKNMDLQDLCPTLVDILSLKYFQQTVEQYHVHASLQEFVCRLCRMLVESTDKKRLAMSRFQERISGLDAPEAELVTRFHRAYVKSLPGKLDHASVVAVNLREMSRYSLRTGGRTQYATYSTRSASPRTSRSLGTLLSRTNSLHIDRSI